MYYFQAREDKCQKAVQDMRIKLIELDQEGMELKFKKTSGDDTTEELKDRQVKIDEEINYRTKKNRFG